MKYSSSTCIADITEVLGSTAVACEGLSDLPYHCDTLNSESSYFHDYCIGKGMYDPIMVYYCRNDVENKNVFDIPENMLAKCDELYKTDADWHLAQCYCCCACMAGATLIDGATGPKALREFLVGDQVLAASIDSEQRPVWVPISVSFSQGSGGGEQPMMVYLQIGAEGVEDFICTMDQPLMLVDGKLTIAGKLRPGQQLMGREGQAVEVHLVALGNYTGGVHHIGTSAAWEGVVDQHLICAAGLVAGTWDLQMYFDELPDTQKEAGYRSLPLLGTPEYEARYGASLQKSDVRFEFSAVNVAGDKHKPTTFRAYYNNPAPLPSHVQKLLTDDQALDLLKYGEQSSFSNPVPQSIFNTIAAQMKGFFPDVTFYYDALRPEPNVYAFKAFGQKIVVVSGGFGRMKGIGYEGLFLAMAQGVARLLDTAPLNHAEYTATGQADGIAFGVISRLCWVGSGLLTYVMAGYGIWAKLFALIDPDHAGGGDPVEDPSIQCRLQNIMSAIAGGSLLECAGGARRPLIALEAATAASDGVDLVFSLALDPDSATDTTNYNFVPEAEVTAATRDDKGFNVHLAARLRTGQSYTVTAKNLQSFLGTGMDPGHNSLPVTFGSTSVKQ